LHFSFDSIGTVTPEKLFIEVGKVEGFEGPAALQEGVTEVKFTSEVKGIDDRFPSGQDKGKGTMIRYPDGTVDASYEGLLMTDKGQFMWRSHEMSKVVDGGKLKGLEILTGFSQSQKLAWMNNLIMVLETQMDLSSQEFTNTAYEWK
jgi:hypothetical protein